MHGLLQLTGLLSVLVLVACGDQQADLSTAAVEPSHADPEPVRYASSVDLSQVKNLHPITAADETWLASLKKGLRFDGTAYYAQLTDCPIQHNGQSIQGTVYYIKTLNRYLIDNKAGLDFCIIPEENRMGIFGAGSRFDVPGSKNLVFLKDSGTPGIVLDLNDSGKLERGDLPAPQVDGLLAKWTFRQ